MSTLSRSARIRANRRAGITRPAPDQTRADLPTCDVADIRNVGYQPSHSKGRVRYSGSGDAGYTSDWAQPASLPFRISVTTGDVRWTATVAS